MLRAVAMVGLLGGFVRSTTATATPTPPNELLQTLTTFETVRSASYIDPVVFSNGTVAQDTKTGSFFRDSTDFSQPGTPSSAIYLRLCSQNASYYLPKGGPCEKNVPLPGQCQCTLPGKANSCSQWAGDVEPTTIPADATYGGSSNIDGVGVQLFSYFDAAFGSVVDAYVSVPATDGAESWLVRFVGARVQTDRTNTTAGTPAATYFAVPTSCKSL